MSNTPTESPSNKDNTKLTLILIYLFWIIGLILHFQNKTAVAAFHLRQTLGLFIAAIVVSIPVVILCIVIAFIPFIGWILSPLIGFAFFVAIFCLWLMGFLGALKGEMKPMPVIGAKIDSMFGKLFE